MTRRLPASLKSLFRMFHGKTPKAVQPATFYDPKSLIHLGRAVAIVYETDKLHGGGDGKICEYIHDFETEVHLFMDERRGKQLYLIGNRLTVTKAGIEN